MFYTIKVKDKNNKVKIEKEFDRKKHIDIKKLLKFYQGKYPGLIVEVS